MRLRSTVLSVAMTIVLGAARVCGADAKPEIASMHPDELAIKGALDKYDRWNWLTFAPVTTDGLRLELRRRGFDRDALPLRDVRELLGYVPWYFNLPDPQFSGAWKQLADPRGLRRAVGTDDRRAGPLRVHHLEILVESRFADPRRPAGAGARAAGPGNPMKPAIA